MTHVWLRAETKPHEQRTALTPAVAQRLVEAGFQLTVEDSRQNLIASSEYEAAGCQIVPADSWKSAAPAEAIVFGLKKLEVEDTPLHHRHIHFAHVFKQQTGWQAALQRFISGGGTLYDLEYLVDANGRRVAAFGYWAGFAGAALSLLGWAGQRSQRTPVLDPVASRANQSDLVADVKRALRDCSGQPTVIVIGALGRSGRGAVSLCEKAGVPITEWDLAETKRGGPFAETLEHDILLNCVFVHQSIPPFLTNDMLRSDLRRLSIICDVSCDPYGQYNPLPIYDKCTTFDDPTLRLIDGDSPLDLIAIDHLPSLLPIESSEDFCQQLLPHLLELTGPEQGVWHRAANVFREKCESVQTPTAKQES